MIATDAALRARGSARARTRTSVRVRRLLGRVRCARPTLGDSSAPSFLFLFFRFVSPLFSSSPTATRPSGGDPPTRFRCHPPAAQCPCLFVRVVYSPSPLSAALMARGVWWQPSDTPNRKKRKNIRAFCWGVSSGRGGTALRTRRLSRRGDRATPPGFARTSLRVAAGGRAGAVAGWSSAAGLAPPIGTDGRGTLSTTVGGACPRPAARGPRLTTTRPPAPRPRVGHTPQPVGSQTCARNPRRRAIAPPQHPPSAERRPPPPPIAAAPARG
jgi:hypothetical protein